MKGDEGVGGGGGAPYSVVSAVGWPIEAGMAPDSLLTPKALHAQQANKHSTQHERRGRERMREERGVWEQGAWKWEKRETNVSGAWGMGLIEKGREKRKRTRKKMRETRVV